MNRTVTAIRRTIRAAIRTHRDTGRLALAHGAILIRAWLVEAGIAQETADRFGSAFGRRAAKTYRTATEEEPHRTWSVVGGKVREVYGYRPSETHILAAALADYRPRDKAAAAEFAAITQRAHYATAA